MFKTYVVNIKFTLTVLKQLVNSGCIMSSKVDMITFIHIVEMISQQAVE